MALTIDDVLRTLPKAPESTKVAETSFEGSATYGGLVRKLAELVRNTPEPELSWTSLNAVKEAGYRSLAPRADEVEDDFEDQRPGAPLRKMANAVRNFENRRATAFFEKNAAALKAIRGLTLLRERMTP